jgi:hypothetical protein
VSTRNTGTNRNEISSGASFEEKYLGLPVPEGRMKAGRFQTTKERFVKRLNAWSEKYMSTGGKEVLIKSVAQSIPTYAMGVFKLTGGFCDDYMKMIRDFWWRDEPDHRKIHWIAWKKMMTPKCIGGMGIRDLRLFNQALLARQAWRLIHFPDSLCARLLKARYFPNGEFIDTVFPADSSPSWKGVEFGLELLKKGLIWRVGSGNQIRIWRHYWIPRIPTMKVTGKKVNCRLRWVSQLMRPDDREWDEALIKRVLLDHDAEEILKIRIPEIRVEDILTWHYEKSGIFTVRSSYRVALQDFLGEQNIGCTSTSTNGSCRIWEKLWSTPVPQKIKNFAWRLANDGLATMQNRKRRHLERDGTCRLCGQEEEDGFHAVIACTKSRALRAELRKS